MTRHDKNRWQEPKGNSRKYELRCDEIIEFLVEQPVDRWDMLLITVLYYYV